MIDRKEIELLIRANLKGGRDIATITKSIADLEKAIDSQAQAANRGEKAYEGLRAAQDALKAVQDELGARNKYLKQLDQSTGAIDRQRAAVERAKKALDAYEAANSGERTDKQQARLQRLEASYQAAQAKLESFQRSATNLNAALQATGADTSDLTGAQRQVADALLATATAQERVNRELRDYTENVNRGKEAARQLAEANKKLAEDDAKRLANVKALADAERRREQEAFDSRAKIEAFAATQVKGRNRQSADSELAAIQDSEEFMRKYAQAKAEAAKQDAGLRKTADEAEAAARQYSTLAKASTNLRPKVVSLREAIDAITNPAAESRKTLAGVESQIKQIAGVISGSTGPIKDYAEQFRNLQAAQKAIGTQAGLIDQFRNQLAVLRDTRTEYVAARGQVAQYAAAVRQGGVAGEQFIKPLAEAQARLRVAANAMREHAQATRDSREALRAAGIDTRNLADAQQRMVAATQQSTSAMKALTAAGAANGVAVRKAGKGFSLFRDEGRTTLSLMQRIRGEVLALTASYLGVQGAIGLAAGALKAFTEKQGLANTLAFALGGDPGKVADEIAYLRDQAERLGISFEQVSKAYAKFAAAAVKSGASVQETRYIFESFAEVGRVLNLTPDALNGLFNAIGQSFSKGKIQAEELRSQIGERLPGAFAFAQQALKKFFPDLDKALVEGKVGAENLLVIAESVRKAASGQVAQAIRALDAEQSRFNNSVLFFKQEIAEAGFADAYVDLLKQLTDYFRSTDGKEFAKTLAQIGSAVVAVLSGLVTFRDELGLLAGLFASVLAAGALAKVGASVLGIGAAAAGATGFVRVFAVAISTLGVALKSLGVLVAVFVAAYSIGNYFYDQYAIVRVFGAKLVTGIAQIWSRIKFGAMELWEDLPRLITNAMISMVNAASEGLKDIFRLLRSGALALGLKDFAATFDRAIGSFVMLKTEGMSQRTKEIRLEAEQDLARIQAIGDQMVKDALKHEGPKLIKPVTATESPGKRAGANDGKGDPAEIAKRERAIEAITRALETLEAKIDKAQTDNLAKQLDAIDIEYQALERRIAALGGADAIGFAKRLQDAVGQLKLQITRKFNDKLLDEQNALLSKVEQAEAAAGRKEKTDLDARLQAISDSYAATYRQIEEQRQKLAGNEMSTGPADEAKRRLDAAVLELKNSERLKFLKEELQRKEQGINDVLKARELSMRAIENEFAAGNITRSQADDQIRALVAEMQPAIEQATLTAEQFARANAAAFDPLTLQEFLNKLAEARNSGAALNAEFDRTGQIIKSGIDTGITSAFDALYDSIGRLTQRTGDWGDVFDNVGKSIVGTIAQVLREMAMLIIKQQILLALQSLTGTTGGGAAAVVKHSGGVIGPTSNRTRNVSPTWFAAAPRYHTGGIAGLAPDEYPAILQRNEEVLSASDPRNVMNGGGATKQAPAQANRFVLVDDRSRMAEAMAGSEGEQVTLVHLRKNLPTLRQWLKG